MRTRLLKPGFTSSVWLFLVLSLVGCGSVPVQNVPPHVAKFSPTVEKIRLKVALRMPAEAGPAVLGGMVGGGPVTAANLRLDEDCLRVARAVFTEVLAQNPAGEPADPAVDAILSPQVIRSVAHVTGIWSWSDTVVTLNVQWRLTDPKGELIWVDTVNGRGQKSTGKPPYWA